MQTHQEDLLVFRSLDLRTTGALVAIGERRVCGFHFMNTSAGRRYVRLYNKATTPLFSDTPVATITVPAGGSVSESLPGAARYSLGIGLRCTTLVADSDQTDAAANDVLAVLYYK